LLLEYGATPLQRVPALPTVKRIEVHASEIPTRSDVTLCHGERRSAFPDFSRYCLQPAEAGKNSSRLPQRASTLGSLVPPWSAKSLGEVQAYIDAGGDGAAPLKCRRARESRMLQTLPLAEHHSTLGMQ
jgi:hypothetical protein